MSKRIAFIVLVLGSFIQTTVSTENDQTTDEPDCMQMGYLCDRKCKTQYICVSTGSHSFNKIKALTCSITNQTCDAINGGCRADDGVTCNAQREKFTCLSPGTFPDPYDCTKYHICNCSEAQADCNITLNKEYVCPGNTAFNPSDNQCTLKLSDDSCIHGPVPRCKNLKDNAALENNPQIYYFCVKDDIYPFVYPQLFQCPKNFHYNSEKLACEVVKTS
ncbi:uncharacterized protein [Anabrus simplex]|uniref:uncharacterized protein n=1 Tax=Anabrus simplex TaxID=316456 RepID=UPI0034DD2934